MKLRWEPITLELKTTFRVAHGASGQRHNVLVYLDDGVGEAAAVPYYGETQQGIVEYLKSVPDLGDDPCDLDGPLLIKNDQYHGLMYDGAKMTLYDGPGIGMTRI